MSKRANAAPAAAAVALAAALLGPACAAVNPSDAPGSMTRAALLEIFRDPPAEYRSAPLWVWNDRITRAEIEEQLADFKAHGLGGVFVHPRPGLITPYLSREWLDLFAHAVAEGRRLGLKVWIYDENSYPSGFAGGHVPARLPDAVRTGLRMTKLAELPRAFDSHPVAVLRPAQAGFEDITASAGSGSFGPGEYYVFDLNRQPPSGWYGGKTYVDIMRPEVTAAFLDITLNAYKRAFGSEFGKVVPGTFQDEAEISPAGGEGMAVVNWTPRLFQAFRSRWGYDLRTSLPSLYDEVGDWAKVRHDFRAVLLDLFLEGWAKPYFEYCRKNNLVFTGHYWEHEWPRPISNPDNMAFAAWAHMPGIDILMNEFQTDTHAQFGNARAVKEIRSVANQMGLARTMSETYGAGGWDLTFFDQKRIADWELALGVNFVNQHLSYVTIMGARKRDHPQSFSYHEPWWEDYRVLGDYLGRLSAVMSLGAQENRILVLEPTTTGWMYGSPRGDSKKMLALGDDFQGFVNKLEAAQVEYDLGSEAVLADHGRAEGGRLVAGPAAYDLVVIAPGTENLESKTVRLLGDLLKQGGKVLCCVDPPAFVDGRADGRIAALAASRPASWISAPGWAAIRRLQELAPGPVAFAIESARPDAPLLLFHHRRALADGQMIFLANTDPRERMAGSFTSPGGACQVWDPFTGQAAAYPSEALGAGLKVRFDLPPGGSALFCVLPAPVPGTPAARETSWTAAPSSPSVVTREAPNVLTLDYCDLALGGKTETDLYFYDAQLKTFRAHGLDRNPWDSAVQYQTNILDKDKFPADSGFEAAFRFRVEAGVPLASLRAVVERPALWKVSLNGRPVDPAPNAWWLDKAFGVYEIGAAAVEGENTLLLKARPFTIHTELEPVYILGDFGLAGAEKGFDLVPVVPLALGPWSHQGLPLYAAGVRYAKTVDLPAGETAGGRVAVELGSWRGAEARVRVNGRPAGVIAFAPFRLDVTEALRPGPNEIAVTVVGTLKNTLGPFHNDPPLGRAWPWSFQQGAKGGRPAGAQYSVVEYGLFEDFRIVRGR